MKLKENRIFAYALLLVSFAANIAAQGGCVTLTQSCCLVEQVAETATQAPTVLGALAISSQGCLSLLQTNFKIATYQINSSTCALGPVQLTTSDLISGLTYSPSGSCLLTFSPNPPLGPSVQLFSSGAGCTLSVIPAFIPTPGVNSVAISSSSPNCVTVGGCSGSYTGTLNSTCGLSLSTAPTPNAPAFKKVAYSPNGSCLAAIDCSGNVNTYSVGSDCSLTPVSSVASSVVPNAVDLAFSPNGSCLVVLNVLPPNGLSSFPVTGCSIPSAPVSNAFVGVGLTPIQLSFSPDGSCIAVAYEANEVGDYGALEMYSFDSTNCALTAVQACLPNQSELGRSGGWSPVGDCLYFVTVGHIYTFTRVSQAVATLSAMPSTVCAGSSITLNAGPTGPGYSYVFSTPSRGTVQYYKSQH